MNKQIGSIVIGIAVALSLVTASYFYGNYQGRQAVKLSYIKKALKLQKKLDDLKKKSDSIIAKAKTNLDNYRRISDAKIQRLIITNKKLKIWWENYVPPAAADYAFGVRKHSTNNLPCRHKTSCGKTSTVKTKRHYYKWRISKNYKKYERLSYN